MTNDIKIDLKSKDLPVTALAYKSPSLLAIILGFTTLWALILFAGLLGSVFLKNIKEDSKRSVKYQEVYTHELDQCELENPDNGRIEYGLEGNITKRYPNVDCFALARSRVKAKFGLSSQ
jgi:hypothetical protein